MLKLATLLDADLGPTSNGILMTPAEFDKAEFKEGWRYELINGVLIVSPIPSINERDPNEELGHLLRAYQENHAQGDQLDATVSEHPLKVGKQRRRPVRVIWTGLGRLPKNSDVPTIVIGLVSKRKRDRQRDYVTKRREYLTLGVKEYWVIDRFRRIMSVFTSRGGKKGGKSISESETYQTPLLPGFQLPLARLIKVANRWKENIIEED